MNRPFQKYITIVLLLIATLTVHAQNANVKRAAQSVCTLTTFAKDGSILGSTRGVFAGPKGEVIAAWHPLKGAEKAVVVDARGNQWTVSTIVGVSELYDICRLQVKGATVAPLALATTDAPVTQMQIVDYDVKKAVARTIKAEKSEKFMTNLNYYLFDDNDVASTDLGCPLINEAGQLIAIMQRPEAGGQAFAADARLTSTFQLTGLSLNDPVLRATNIRPALPSNEKDAQITLMLSAQQADSARYIAYIDDYIAAFPTSATGYSARAIQQAATGQLREADKTMQDAVRLVNNKEEALADYAKLVYQYALAPTDSTFTIWTFKKAEEMAAEAYAAKQEPMYKHIEAQAAYAQGNFARALTLFTDLQQTPMGKNGEVYYEAAQCKAQLKAPQEEILDLLNKAVNAQEGALAAPYLQARANYYSEIGEDRKAFADYLRCDTLLNFRGTHDFYYAKFLCEKKIRQYQLAINDIAHAIMLNPQQPIYFAELANLQLRVNKLDDAVKTCDIGLSRFQGYADLHIIRGIALCENKQKEEGLKSFQKAKELGDARAEDLIKKYQ